MLPRYRVILAVFGFVILHALILINILTTNIFVEFISPSYFDNNINLVGFSQINQSIYSLTNITNSNCSGISACNSKICGVNNKPYQFIGLPNLSCQNNYLHFWNILDLAANMVYTIEICLMVITILLVLGELLASCCKPSINQIRREDYTLLRTPEPRNPYKIYNIIYVVLCLLIFILIIFSQIKQLITITDLLSNNWHYYGYIKFAGLVFQVIIGVSLFILGF